jgi:hypothetical protein
MHQKQQQKEALHFATERIYEFCMTLNNQQPSLPYLPTGFYN